MRKQFAKIAGFIPCEPEKGEIHQTRLSVRGGDYDD
jgi:hypothetical protein